MKWARDNARGSIAATMLFIAGCAQDHAQSALNPASPASRSIADLWWFLFAVCTVVFMLTMLALFMAIVRRSHSGAPLGTRFIVITGIAIPAVVLIVMLFASLGTSMALREQPSELTIRVIGHRWWWEVHYPDHNIVTANEVHIPTGVPVRIELTSADVIHSFWVPNLQGKVDMIPGHVNTMWIQADEAGPFRGQCAEFCGAQHARMAFEVIAMDRPAFEAWVQARQQMHGEPQNDVHARGLEVFFEAACYNCHSIQGTEARGAIGPDLTHLASRRQIAAGQLRNSYGNLAGWVSNPQAIKPGNRMPRSYIDPNDLHALVEYLLTLE